MSQNWEEIGVRGVYDGQDLLTGLEKQNKALEKANKTVDTFVKRTAGSVEKVTKTYAKGLKEPVKRVEEYADTIAGETMKTRTEYLRLADAAKLSLSSQEQSFLDAGKRVEVFTGQTEQGLTKITRTFQGAGEEANRIVVEQREAVEGGQKVIRSEYNRTADAIGDSTKKAADGTRRFIKSISAIFALTRLLPALTQQLGDAFREAAAGRAVRQSFVNLADTVSVNMNRLLADMKRASKGTVAEMELMTAANRAMLAGGQEFAQAMPRLLEISRAAAVATGKDFRFVYDTLTQGIARASAKLIDNAEIYFKVGKAVEDYGETLGKSVNEMTKAEQQHAILNAVLAQGSSVARDVGTDIEVATDRYDRFTASVTDAKRAVLDFIDETTGIGPVVKLVGDTADSFAVLAQTVALLSLAGFGTALKAFGAALLTTVLPAVLAVTAGLLAGVKIYDEFIARFSSLPRVGKTIEDLFKLRDLVGLGRAFEFWKIQTLESREAAQEWIRSVHEQEQAEEALRESKVKLSQAIFKVNKEYGLGVFAYRAYLQEVEKINDELPKGVEKIRAMSEETFRLSQVMKLASGSTKLMLGEVDKLVERGSSFEGVWGALTTEIFRFQQAQFQATAEQEKANRQTEIAARRLETQLDFQKKAADAVEESAEKIKDLEADLNQDIEQEAERHADKMKDLAEDAAFARVDAFADYEKNVRNAERKRNRAIQEARIKHVFRLEDIEYTHRRRLEDIEHDFQISVRDAAARRDALGIIRASRRRQEEIRDAGRDREDAIRGETRQHQERLRVIEQTYQDQLLKARETLAEELAEIERNLARRLAKERENWNQRKTDLDNNIAYEIAAEREKYAQLLRELGWYVRQANRLRASLQQPGLGLQQQLREGGELSGDAGFSGIVRGPQTFKVGAGVTEYVYMGGDMRKGKRESVLPSRAASQMQGLRASVGGQVGVGMSGFSQGLMNRISGQMTDMIGQAVIDQIALQIEGWAA